MTPPESGSTDYFDVTLPPRPYPGLRPFRKSEWPVFFGREPMTDDVIQQLIAKRFVMVHGDSGCGKSSLLKAGVFSRLEQQNARGGLTWRTCAFEPGRDPLGRLAQSLGELMPADTDRADATLDIRRALNLGRDAPEAIARMLLRSEADHLCILADQFEELFAFVKNSGRREEAGLLVQLLVGILERPPRGLYAVATMRSEFLGECAQFTDFAEAVNRSPYLVPRMAHSDLLRAIRDPATLYDGQVSLMLAERLIADAGRGQDELPLIQNGLMLLHRSKLPAAESAPWRLDVGDYTAADLTQLLSDYADALTPKGREPAVESVFRALTQINAEGREVRRPQLFKTLCDVAGVDAATLNTVLLPFRQEGASLLRPYGATPLVDTDEVSISHEALIRCWKKIADRPNGWLQREFRDRLTWQALDVQARSFQEDRSNVLSPATAQDRATWLADKRQAWAELNRSTSWSAVQDLVRESVDAAQRAKDKEVRRQRWVVSSAVAVTLVVAGFALWISLVSVRLAKALDETNNARADSLWNRLDFNDTLNITEDELRALWDVAQATPGVHREFVNRLVQNAGKLRRRPAPVIRAIGLQWPAAQQSAVWDALLDALKEPSADRESLWAVSRALPGQPSVAQQQRLATELQTALQNRASKAALLDAVSQFQAGRPRAEDCTPALDALIDEIAASAPDSKVAELLNGLPGWPSAGKVEKAFSALSPRILAEADTVSGIDKDFDAVLKAVTAKVPKERLRELESLVKLVNKTASSQAVASVVDILVSSVALASDEGRAMLTPVVTQLVAARDTDRVSALAPVLQVVPTALNDVQAHSVFAMFVRALPTGSVITGMDFRVQETIARITPRLPPTQASLLREALLKGVTATTADRRLHDLAIALRAVPGIPGRSDQAVLDLAVRELQRRGDTPRMRAMASIAGAVPIALTASQEEAVVKTLVAALSGATDGIDQILLVQALEQIGPKLSFAQATASLTVLLAMVARTSEPDVLEALARAVAAIPGAGPPPAEAGAVLTRAIGLLCACDGETYHDPRRLATLSSLVRVLLARVPAAEAAPGLEKLLSSLQATDDADRLAAMISALSSSHALLSRNQQLEVIRQARTLLAWSRSPGASADGVRAFAELTVHQGEAAFVRGLVDLLRYPAVPAVQVIAAMRKTVPATPPPEARPDEVLTWIGRTYPGVLDQPVLRPDHRAFVSSSGGGGF